MISRCTLFCAKPVLFKNQESGIMRKFILLGLTGCLCACSVIPKGNIVPRKMEAATAILKRGDAPVGTAALSQSGADIALAVNVSGLNDGTYAMHLHQTGKCEGPDYKSAGPHWNPGNRQHGLNNPQGAHGGDLPNLMVTGGEPASFSAVIPNIALTGPAGLMDADGAAIIIHAKADDGTTDPSGNSGDRMICGVLTLEE
jgi:superoxide dismutase, Cu-Zn family